MFSLASAVVRKRRVSPSSEKRRETPAIMDGVTDQFVESLFVDGKQAEGKALH